MDHYSPSSRGRSSPRRAILEHEGSSYTRNRARGLSRSPSRDYRRPRRGGTKDRSRHSYKERPRTSHNSRRNRSQSPDRSLPPRGIRSYRDRESRTPNRSIPHATNLRSPSNSPASSQDSAEDENTEPDVFGRTRRSRAIPGPVDLFVHSIEHNLTPSFSADAELCILYAPQFMGLHNIVNSTADDRRRRFDEGRFAHRIVLRHVIEDRRATHIINDDGVFDVLEGFLKDGVYTSVDAFLARFGDEADRILLAIEARRFIDNDIGLGTAENTMLLKHKKAVLQIVLDATEKPIYDYISDTKGVVARMMEVSQAGRFDLSQNNYITYFQKFDNDPLFLTDYFIDMMMISTDVRNNLRNKDDLSVENVITAARNAINVNLCFSNLRKEQPSRREQYLYRLIDLMRTWEEKDAIYDRMWQSLLMVRFETLPIKNLAENLFNCGAIESRDEEIYLEEKRLEYQKGEIACRFLQEAHYRKKLMGNEAVKFLREVFSGRRPHHDEFPWADIEATCIQFAREEERNPGDPHGRRQ